MCSESDTRTTAVPYSFDYSLRCNNRCFDRAHAIHFSADSHARLKRMRAGRAGADQIARL
jgi:hypothetical protein